MSDKLGVKLGLEGEKDFKKALADINSSFKVLGSEMKLAQSQFGKNDNSVSALTAKNEVLNKQITQQKEKVEVLKNALDNASKSFGETDKRTQNWQTKLNNAQAELNNMERELDGNKKALNDAANAMDNAGDNADKLADDMEDVGEETENSSGHFEKFGSVVKTIGAAAAASIAAIGAAAVAAGKEIVSMVNDTAAAGDEIDKASQAAGMGSTAFQEWSYVLDRNGASADSLSTWMKKLNNNVDDAAGGSATAVEKFSRLGISIEDLQNKSREDVFAEVIAGLQNMDNESERAAVANDLLGGSATDLGALLNSTAEDTNALRQNAHDLGLVMSEDAVKASANYEDALTDLKGAFTGVKNSISSELLPGFTDVMHGLTGLITGEENAAETLKSGMSDIIDSVSSAVPKFLDLISNVISSVSASAPEIITSLVSGITDNLPMLITAAQQILSALIDGIIQALPALTDGAVQLILALTNGIVENLPAITEAAVQMIVTLAAGLGEALPELIPAIVQCIVTIVQTLLDNMDQILEAALLLIQGLSDGIIAALPVLIDALPQIIQSIVEFVINNLPLILDTAVQIMLAIIEGLLQTLPQLVEIIP